MMNYVWKIVNRCNVIGCFTIQNSWFGESRIIRRVMGKQNCNVYKRVTFTIIVERVNSFANFWICSTMKPCTRFPSNSLWFPSESLWFPSDSLLVSSSSDMISYLADKNVKDVKAPKSPILNVLAGSKSVGVWMSSSRIPFSWSVG